MNQLFDVDTTVFFFFNRDCHNAVLDFLMPYITQLGGGVFVTAVAVIMLFMRNRDVRMSGVLLLAGETLLYYIVYVVKHLMARPRPFVALADVNLLVPTDGFSFPSYHSATAFMAAVVLAACFKRWRYAFYGIAALVALSRVYIGVHYPSDILIGGCLGALVGYALVRVAKNVKNPSGS
jgi:undecaprenyl-diphosphatase